MSTTSAFTMPYSIVRLGKSSDDQLFVKVRIQVAGKRRTKIVSVHDLQIAPDQTLARIPNLISVSRKNQFKKDVENAVLNMPPTFKVAIKTGFSGRSFVLADGSVVGDAISVCLPEQVGRYAGRFRSKGSLEAWKEVSRIAVGNSRFLLALALAFTGPVVDLLQLSAPMINLFGKAGTGKSSIALAAGSVVGGNADGEFCDSWNNTINNVEVVAVAHHATLSVHDETKLAAKTEEILGAVMRLDQGHEKGRMTNATLGQRFRVPVISTSNHSLCELARRDRVNYDEAHSSRMVDVPLPREADGADGAFENLHGRRDASELSIYITNIAKANHGVAFRHFLESLTGSLEKDFEGTTARLTKRRNAYLSYVKDRLESDLVAIDRVNGHFATIFAAGRLAIEYKLLPITPRELARALLLCQRDYVDHVSPFLTGQRAVSALSRAATPLSVLQRVSEYVKRSKLVDLRLGLPLKGEHDHETCPGYIFKGAAGVEYLFSNAVFVCICGGQREAKELKAQLAAAGLLVRDTHRPSTRRQVWQSRRGERVQVVAIKAEAFG